MSRPYRIVVKKVVESEVRARDHSKLRLRLDPVLPEERLNEVLGEVLERNGWSQVDDGIYQKERGGGQTCSIDVASREVTTTVELERTVSEEVQREIRGDTWNWREMREQTAEELAARRRAAERELDAEVSEANRRSAERELQEEATSRVDQAAATTRQELNRVVLEVISEAIKEKAAELGTVERVDERWDGEQYELTIAVSE